MRDNNPLSPKSNLLDIAPRKALLADRDHLAKRNDVRADNPTEALASEVRAARRERLEVVGYLLAPRELVDQPRVS